MSDSARNTKEAIARAKPQLQLLEQLDQFESEFRLIETEYRQRREEIKCHLEELGKLPPLLTE